jgi:pimeloyl-ACP methyl ester carboxylesterase
MRRFAPIAWSLTAALALTASAPAALAAEKKGNSPFLTVQQLRDKYADPVGKIANIDGQEVYYKDEGSGPVLLMVHGSQSSIRTYDRIAELLKDRYRIIRFDVPSWGLSGDVPENVAQNLRPSDIPAKLLAHLGVDKVDCVGVSSGGTMCLYLAAQHPELVDRLILSNMPSDPVTTDHLVEPDSFRKAQADSNARGHRDRVFWDEFLSYFAGDPSRISDKTRAEYTDFNLRKPDKHIITMVARIGDGKEARVLMQNVKNPTLLIWGAKDQLLPPIAAANLANYLPNALVSRVFMPDVGHYPPLESPDRFAGLIDAFVQNATPILDGNTPNP